MKTCINLLVIEDYPADFQLIVRRLAQDGLTARCHCAANLGELEAAIAQGGWDAVLSDYSVPKMDFNHTLGLLQAHHPDLPIILVSGSVGEEKAVELLKLGVWDFVLKDNLTRLAPAIEHSLHEAADRRERKRAQEALLNEKTFSDSVINSMPGLFSMSDEQGRSIRWNAAFAKAVGDASKEHGSQKLFESVCDEDRESVRAALERTRVQGEASVEARLVTKDGLRYFHFAARRLQIGAQSYLVATGLDITDRKQAERALDEQKQLLQTLVNHLPVAVYLKDPAGRKMLTNPMDMDNLGVRCEAELIGKTDFDFLPPEEAARIRAGEQQVLARGQSLLNQEDKVIKPDGSVRWFLNSKVPLFDTVGRVTGLAGIGLDITERHQLQDQLIQAQKMEAVGQLAGGIAHDFNNILTAMLMQLDLLQSEEGLSAEVRAGLGELETGANRAVSLTRQLLMFSRRQMLQRQVLDLNSLLGNLLKMLRRLIGEHIGLEFNGAPFGLWVEVDPGMLEQVVMNLVVNARDAMPNGGRITLATRTVGIDKCVHEPYPEAAPGQFVCLTVTDTGCGMDATVMKHVFEPFFTTKEAGKGTGLGLATVDSIVKQHGGWVEIESALGKGSAFSVYLPAKAQVFAISDDKDSVATVKGGSETVLLVEDEELVRQTAFALFHKLGYRVFEAASGPEALQLWQHHAGNVDLLLTDAVMPGGMSGMELAEQLLAQNARLKVILMSGYSLEIVRRDAPKQAGIAFLQKPFAASALAKLVRDCLDAK